MVHSGESDFEKMRIHLMFIEENRVQSFKDWVFDRCECTPKKVVLLHICNLTLALNLSKGYLLARGTVFEEAFPGLHSWTRV